MSDAQAFRFEDDGETPNNPRLPLLVHRAASTRRASAIRQRLERAFARHFWAMAGATASILPALPHRHARGAGIGAAAPPWNSAAPRAGAHGRGGRCRRAAGRHGPSAPSASGDLLVVGAYPRNASFDQKRPGQVDHKKAVAAIAEVPIPEMDPVHGREGPLTTLWKSAVK
jgi:uncharacterized protein YjlB